jgi:pyruvate/2-oxoglutarate dehydrogenase complex dihydrolipoamide dehydrogenase (E3) component
MRPYDAVVLGGGPVDLSVADPARAGELSVAVVELELLGGECRCWARVSSNAMLRPVAAVAPARRVDGAREAVGPKAAKSALSAASPSWAACRNTSLAIDHEAGLLCFHCRRLGPSPRSECWGVPDAARHV